MMTYRTMTCLRKPIENYYNTSIMVRNFNKKHKTEIVSRHQRDLCVLVTVTVIITVTVTVSHENNTTGYLIDKK
jgi:hypothetical protein